MKTKELIKELQRCDPSGEEEVCVNGEDILFIQPLNAYYDGCLEVLIRDPDLKPYYDIVGGEFRANGNKISIQTLSIRDAMIDDVDLPVTFDSEYAKKHWEDRVSEWRERARKMLEELDEWKKNK